MKVNLLNPETRHIKQTKLGFSWTVLFFGCFPMLIRGDFLWGIVVALINVLFFPIAPIVDIVLAFMYNKIYIKSLLSKGYIPADEASKQALINKGIPIATQVIIDDAIKTNQA